jgi:hypothetical protein
LAESPGASSYVALVVDPFTATTLYATLSPVGPAVITRSTDNGATWSDITPNPYPGHPLAVTAVAADQKTQSVLYLATTGVANAQVYWSNHGRFSVTTTFQATPSGPSAPASAVALTGDTGYFWFFDPTNIELVTKVLNGCAINNEYWVFAGGLTDVGVQIKVTDTLTGAVRMYSNPAGTAFQPIQDSSAFPCP